MAQNMGIPYFINALEEEDDFDELAPECRPIEQFLNESRLCLETKQIQWRNIMRRNLESDSVSQNVQ